MRWTDSETPAFRRSALPWQPVLWAITSWAIKAAALSALQSLRRCLALLCTPALRLRSLMSSQWRRLAAFSLGTDEWHDDCLDDDWLTVQHLNYCLLLPDARRPSNPIGTDPGSDGG